MILVTSYVNPDLDGVACAIAFAEYLAQETARPYLAGKPNSETEGVLSTVGLDADGLFPNFDVGAADKIILVDCHHPAQLPAFVNPAAVVSVVDHHPDGQPAAFPNADIQNETVGAAATLIAERIFEEETRGLKEMTAAHAVLLACAIASNTLDFTAHSTTLRDRHVFSSLESRTGSPNLLQGLLETMRRWRMEVLLDTTDFAVNRDVKVIGTALGTVAVSQVEADGVSAILTRPDLNAVMAALTTELSVKYSLLSLVDTAVDATYLYSNDYRLIEALMSLQAIRVNDHTLRLPFIALRKTHVIPALTKIPAEM